MKQKVDSLNDQTTQVDAQNKSLEAEIAQVGSYKSPPLTSARTKPPASHRPQRLGSAGNLRRRQEQVGIHHHVPRNPLGDPLVRPDDAARPIAHWPPLLYVNISLSASLSLFALFGIAWLFGISVFGIAILGFT